MNLHKQSVACTRHTGGFLFRKTAATRNYRRNVIVFSSENDGEGFISSCGTVFMQTAPQKLFLVINSEPENLEVTSARGFSAGVSLLWDG